MAVPCPGGQEGTEPSRECTRGHKRNTRGHKPPCHAWGHFIPLGLEKGAMPGGRECTAQFVAWLAASQLFPEDQRQSLEAAPTLPGQGSHHSLSGFLIMTGWDEQNEESS